MNVIGSKDYKNQICMTCKEIMNGLWKSAKDYFWPTKTSYCSVKFEIVNRIYFDMIKPDN